jgi:hypothetical protein
MEVLRKVKHRKVKQEKKKLLPFGLGYPVQLL